MPKADSWLDRPIGRLGPMGGLQRVAGEERRFARPGGFLEQQANLRGLHGIGEGAGDQTPLLIGHLHASRLKPGDERCVIGEIFAPQRSQGILLVDAADLDAEPRSAVIGGSGKSWYRSETGPLGGCWRGRRLVSGYGRGD